MFDETILNVKKSLDDDKEICSNTLSEIYK